jgi:hypothetical protein
MTIIRRSVSSPRAAAELIEGRTSTQPDTLPNLTTQQLLLIAAREYRDTAAIRASLEPLEQLAWPSTSLGHVAHRARPDAEGGLPDEPPERPPHPEGAVLHPCP